MLLNSVRESLAYYTPYHSRGYLITMHGDRPLSQVRFVATELGSVRRISSHTNELSSVPVAVWRRCLAAWSLERAARSGERQAHAEKLLRDRKFRTPPISEVLAPVHRCDSKFRFEHY